jgi:ferredoxin-NAD(P)+ reductase (naphthalene dioxygenase ferredoxin-specific)
LDAVLRLEIPFSHGCRSGTCGACKCRLVSGEVELTSHSAYALTERDRDAGLVLACRAYPRSDGEISRLSNVEVINHPLCRLACEVTGFEDLTHEIRRIRLRVVKGGRFSFGAGQFASVTFQGQPSRDYSMANRPRDPLLEFHVRRNDSGASSIHATTTLREGEEVRVDGPYGTCWLRENHSGPILAVAGGSGLAPMKSIVETALAKGARQKIHLLLAVLEERDIYLEEHFRHLEQRFANFRFTPVLARGAASARRSIGLVHDVVLASSYDFDGIKIYSAGPSDMVEALTRTLVAEGVQPEDIHAEPFHIAPVETRKQEGKN